MRADITQANVSQCLPIFLFSTELSSHHPLNSPTEGGKNDFFFLSKPKSNEWRKNLLRWGSQPCEISSCEIGAHLAWSQWVRWKIPFHGDRNNQNASWLSCRAFSFPLTTTHYSLPHSLIHLSELFQVDASYLSLTPLPGTISIDVLITGLESNPFKIAPSLSSLPLLFCRLCYSCIAPLLSSSTSSLLSIISSFLPPLHLCPTFLCFSWHLYIKASTWVLSWERFQKALTQACTLYFDLVHRLL